MLRCRVPSRVLTLLGGVLIGTSAAAIACSFPEPTFGPDDPKDGSSDTTNSSSGSSGSDGSSSGSDGALNPDGNACLGDPVCDCDGDQDLAVACDGGDCDDHDPRRRSTQTSYQDAAPALGKNGDWNCNKVVEREGDPGVSCSNILDGGVVQQAIAVVACQKEGFTSDPECGEVATYTYCKFNGTTTAAKCIEDHHETRARGCR